jgi:iron complex outermembrane receptor protein
LTNTLQVNKFNVFLRNVYFGKVTEATPDLLMQQDFSEKLVTDLSLGYNMSKSATLTVGANNLFDIYPDKAAQDLKPDVAGDQNNRSNGRFDWSRRAQQFGIGGRFMFARLTFEIK